MEIIKVIVAGGRNFDDYALLKKSLDEYLKPLVGDGVSIEIVSGAASGADSLGEKYAKERGYGVKRFPALWNDIDRPGAVIRTNGWGGKYDVNAGFARNEQMAEYADVLVLFWNGSSKGSKHMLDTMKKQFKPVQIITYK
jgi:hypothetical protein